MNAAHRSVLLIVAVVAVLALTSHAQGAAPLSIDLSGVDAASRWFLLDKTAEIRDGELILDGRQRMSRAFFKPWAWQDAALEAQFRVDPQDTGVLACGFVVRASDAKTFYYVHFDRAQAILVRSSPDVQWNEIRRVSGLTKPAGEWHHASLRCAGSRLEVHLNGKLLFDAKDSHLKHGRVGFYANQGRARVKDIKVHGKKTLARPEFPVPLPSFTFVCEDAGAGAYEAFPDVCRLADGRLMCVFYAGYGHVSLPNDRLPKGGRVSYVTSSDEGRTWSRAQVLYDGPQDDRDPSIVQLADGRVLCNFFSLRKRASGGLEFAGSFLVASNDGGRTWSQPQVISENYATSTPIRVLRDGRLILGLYYEKDGVARGAVTISDDAGRTWSRPVDIDNNGKYLDAETDVIELADGRLYAAQRGGKGAQMHWAISKDRGQTWTTSRPIGFAAHCPYLHRSREGVLLLAHRIPSTSLHYSLDEGATWSSNVLVDSTSGAYPSMVDLADGSILIVYYEEGGGSSIRAKRFRATKEGIRWIPPGQSTDAVGEQWIWSNAHRIPRRFTSEESGYFSLITGRDGKIYIGTAKYQDNAYLVEFDPATKTMKMVVDCEKEIGIDAKDFAAQAKIHTRNNVGRSGKIYFGTKQGYPVKKEPRIAYPGGYPMVYDPQTGKTKVYGIPVPHQGIISVTPDESRGVAYISTCSDARPYESTHFLILDLKTGKYRDLLDCEHMYAFIVVDHRGRAYHPIRGGKIARYDPDADRLDTLEQTIDGKPPSKESLLAHPDSHPINWDLSPDRKTLYAVAMSGNAIYSYDLTGTDKTLRGKRLGALFPGAKMTDCRAFCVGPNGTLWAGVAAKVPDRPERLRLVSHRPGDRDARDHGAIAIANPDYYSPTGPDGKPLSHQHGVHRAGPGDALIPRYVIMAICATGKDKVYLTTLYPFTLHELDVR